MLTIRNLAKVRTEALLGVYELNKIGLIIDVVIRHYEASPARSVGVASRLANPILPDFAIAITSDDAQLPSAIAVAGPLAAGGGSH
jgi:hypothetical protein